MLESTSIKKEVGKYKLVPTEYRIHRAEDGRFYPQYKECFMWNNFVEFGNTSVQTKFVRLADAIEFLDRNKG